RIYDPVKDKVLDTEFVKEKFGLAPGRIPEFMALTGDAVDNIPGVKGIGEKTARELLTSFHDLDDLLNHPNAIKKEKLRNLIIENRDIARMSKRLATIDTSVPMDIDISEFALQEPHWPALLTLFSEFGFGSLMKLVPSAKRENRYETVLSLDALQGLLTSIRDEFAFDIEAAGRSPLNDTIVGIALSNEKNQAWYLPLAHSATGTPGQIRKEEAFKALSPFFENNAIAKIGHNLKYDLRMLRHEGITVNGTLYDTMLASYLLNPNKSNHSLQDVAFEHFSYRKRTFEEVLGKRASFAEVPVEEASAYAAEDAALAFELKELLFEKVQNEGMERLYHDVEMPLVRVLADIEEAGFKVDDRTLHDLSKELERELDAIQRRVYFLAGEEFNINSPKQLSRVLFHTLGLKPGKKTKTGFSTEVGVLEDLAENHDLPKEILDYRSLSKLKSTYTDVLPYLIQPQTGRIHTSFNQTVTATGRLSSSDPNLQNIPIRGEWGRRIRTAFIAEEGNVLISADYSQIELRILACLSRDQGLIDAFLSGVDVHTRTASEIFGVPMEMVTPAMRRTAKTVNFGIVYGISPFGLSEALSIPRENAKKYIDGYFQGHPGVRAYIEQALNDARQRGFVTTLFGRKRAVPEIMSSNATTRSLGERLAINSPVQGSAADIIKIAMIALWNSLGQEGLKARIILQVHDELVLETAANEVGRVTDMIREKMEGAVDIAVPLKVEIGHGRNWAEAHA
ncbi:MAG: DNA polymerase I, partial [Thermodesulfovibrionales bacterium]